MNMDKLHYGRPFVIAGLVTFALAAAGACAPGGSGSRGVGTNATVSISFPNGDIVADNETLAVRCVAAGDGAQAQPDGLGGVAIFPANPPRATLAPNRANAPPDPLTLNSTLTPLPDPGSNREANLTCQAWDLGGVSTADNGTVLITETVDPEIEPFVITSTAAVPGEVSVPFFVMVEAKDNDDRASSGLDDLNLTTLHPLRPRGAMAVEFRGVPPGPPQNRGTRGPIDATHQYEIVCIEAGSGTFVVTVRDAAGNSARRRGMIECFDP